MTRNKAGSRCRASSRGACLNRFAGQAPLSFRAPPRRPYGGRETRDEGREIRATKSPCRPSPTATREPHPLTYTYVYVSLYKLISYLTKLRMVLKLDNGQWTLRGAVVVAPRIGCGARKRADLNEKKEKSKYILILSVP